MGFGDPVTLLAGARWQLGLAFQERVWLGVWWGQLVPRGWYSHVGSVRQWGRAPALVSPPNMAQGQPPARFLAGARLRGANLLCQVAAVVFV